MRAICIFYLKVYWLHTVSREFGYNSESGKGTDTQNLCWRVCCSAEILIWLLYCIKKLPDSPGRPIRCWWVMGTGTDFVPSVLIGEQSYMKKLVFLEPWPFSPRPPVCLLSGWVVIVRTWRVTFRPTSTGSLEDRHSGVCLLLGCGGGSGRKGSSRAVQGGHLGGLLLLLHGGWSALSTAVSVKFQSR